MRNRHLLAASLILGALLGLAPSREARGDDATAPEPLPAPAPEPGVDLLGDPLPARALARLGTSRLRHGNYIGFLGLTPDGKQVITRDGAGSYYVWDAVTGKEVRRFGESPMSAIYGGTQLSPDGCFLAASGGIDRAARLWEVATGKEVWQTKPADNTYAPAPLAFSPDGKTLLTRGNSGDFQLREALTGSQLWEVKFGPQARNVVFVSFAPDSKRLAFKNGDGSIKLFDVATGQALPHFAVQLDTKKFGSVASTPVFSPDGTLLASASIERKDNKLFGVVHVWETESGKEVRQINGPSEGVRTPSPAFAPDFRAVAWGVNDGTVRLHDLETGKELRKIGEPGPERGGSGTPVFSFDGKLLVWRTLRGGLVVWDLAADKEINLAGQALGVGIFTLSTDGKLLAIVTPNYAVRLWDLPSGKERLGESSGHNGNIVALAVAADGHTASSIGADGTLRRWETHTGKELLRASLGATARPFFSALAPDGQTAAVGALKDNVFNTIELWDTATGKPLRQIDLQQSLEFGSLAFMPDGKTLLGRERGAVVRLWEVSSGRALGQAAIQANPGEPAGNMAGRSVLSPDGKMLASAWTSRNPATNRTTTDVRLWQLSSGKMIGRLPVATTSILSMAFAPDGRSLALVYYNAPVTPQRPVIAPTYAVGLWEVVSGKERCQWTPPGRATTIAFAPDGRTMAVGFAEGTIQLLSAQTGATLGQLKGHRGTVQQLVFAADSRQLLSSGFDSTGLVWDAASVALPKPAPTELSMAQLDSLWTELGSDDAGKAFKALDSLTGSSGPIVPWLAQRVKAAVADDELARIDKLIADLDSDKFAVRQQASEELAKLGERAVPALEKVLATKPTLDLRQRVDELLAKVTTFQVPPDVLHGMRAIEALERIGTPEARQVVEGLAKGAAGGRLTQDAQRALERLSKAQ
jgi:WD40 repeat protein